MKLTRKQKTQIKAHYSYMPLRFMADGTVMAKKSSWGVLYTPEQTKSHLDAI